MTELIGQSFGRYRILEQLGEGGMATVFKAHDTRLETDVAVKIIRTDNLPPNLLDTMLKRFDREAKSLARLKHPNIVVVSDYGEHAGIPYLVMPLLQGGTLKEYLKRGTLSWQESIRLLRPIISALEFAHGENIIHRDLKPANILLTETGQPMLADFGIAKILEVSEKNTLTGEGVGIGTPEYMAPEQWIGDATALSDVYSLGVVLYEMIAGRKPYIADTPAAIFLKQTSDPVPSLTKIVPTLPDELEQILNKALAKKPEDRYQTMQEFGNALDGLRRGTSPSTKRALQLDQTPAEVAINTSVTEKDSQTKVESASQQQSSKRTWVGGTAIILLGIVIVVAASVIKQRTTFAPIATATVTKTRVVETPTRVIPTPTTNPLGIGSTTTSRDGVTLVYVPEGEFQMGSDANIYPQEPVHAVYLESYWIDQTEVTNSMYHKCVLTSACSPPSDYSLGGEYNGYYGLPKFDNFPVVFVNWEQANAYCQWAGRRLPTEAEWEKAARSMDERIYPWGNDAPNSDFANYTSINSVKRGPTEVGNYHPRGDSPYGVYDMAGNATEWVGDWFSYTYYSESPYENPTGPTSGEDFRITRGGSWAGDDLAIFSYYRFNTIPTDASTDIGFRCAVSADSLVVASEQIDILQNDNSSIKGQDGAVLIPVPAGEFKMGGDSELFYNEEVPIHSVYLDDYWIDRTEVTNVMYHRCVVARECPPPYAFKLYKFSSDFGIYWEYYYGLPQFDDFPVVNVDWEQANAYCQWAGRRLPTEAEWEKAARGTDARLFPWGDETPSGTSLNFAGSYYEFTSLVGLFSPQGDSSPYGVYDMAGNVTEWVADWHSDSYLSDSPPENPTGPIEGENRVIRGNSWRSSDAMPIYTRGAGSPDENGDALGFRCATSDISNSPQSTTEVTQAASETKSVYFVDYTATGGETCENIASGYGIPLEDILSRNPILNKACSLIPGQAITFEAPYSTEEDFSPVCEDKWAFISHVNIPDGTIIAPGQTFTKSWRIQNIGTCVWNSRYSLSTYWTAAIRGSTRIFALFENVQPGEAVDISITLTAPKLPGEYYGYWDFSDALFNTIPGDGLRLTIQVK